MLVVAASVVGIGIGIGVGGTCTGGRLTPGTGTGGLTGGAGGVGVPVTGSGIGGVGEWTGGGVGAGATGSRALERVPVAWVLRVLAGGFPDTGVLGEVRTVLWPR